MELALRSLTATGFDRERWPVESLDDTNLTRATGSASSTIETLCLSGTRAGDRDSVCLSGTRVGDRDSDTRDVRDTVTAVTGGPCIGVSGSANLNSSTLDLGQTQRNTVGVSTGAGFTGGNNVVAFRNYDAFGTVVWEGLSPRRSARAAAEPGQGNECPGHSPVDGSRRSDSCSES